MSWEFIFYSTHDKFRCVLLIRYVRSKALTIFKNNVDIVHSSRTITKMICIAESYTFCFVFCQTIRARAGLIWKLQEFDILSGANIFCANIFCAGIVLELSDYSEMFWEAKNKTYENHEILLYVICLIR